MESCGTYKKIEEMTNQYVKEHVLKTIKKVQKDYGVDVFGFGESLTIVKITKTLKELKSLG